MNSFGELTAYYCVKIFGAFLRVLPIGFALRIGRWGGLAAYYLDGKRRHLAYTNLKIAFAKTKSPHELRKINKQSFRNFGQIAVEILRLPLMDLANLQKFVKIEGQEHVMNALKEGKGVILLANHFGNWELASKAGAAMVAQAGNTYKVIVNRQKKAEKLNELLNSYRIFPGSGVIERGAAVRQAIKSLRNNEVVAIVVDQGGRDGTLVPFFDRQASLADGAIRMALKMGTPVCFVNLVRQKGPYHRLIFHEPLKLINTGDQQKDVEQNLRQVTQLMEQYIRDYPADYMWFYKIWKYSKESTLLIIHDGKTGHLRQSQNVTAMVEKVLTEKGIRCSTATLEVKYKGRWASRLISVLSVLFSGCFSGGHMGFLRWFLEKDSFTQMMALKADVIISCGSSVAGINNLLANEQQAKSIVILKPGLLSPSRFDLVVLPQHDQPQKADNVVITKGAPNLITPEYLDQQSKLLLNRYSHLKLRGKLKIGVLIGGDTKDYFLSEHNVKLVINQVREVADEINADILLTTSRRTSEKVESMLQREIKKIAACQLFISASRNNIPEALGGILGLSDIIVVSGDSISMISEAASSGKDTVVFPVQNYPHAIAGMHKHNHFIDQLNTDGYIVSVSMKDVRRAIYDVAKNKIKTRKLDDNAAILEAVRKTI